MNPNDFTFYKENGNIMSMGFNVKNLYTQTINNEKRLVDLLADKIAEKIFYEISNRVNDL